MSQSSQLESRRKTNQVDGTLPAEYLHALIEKSSDAISLVDKEGKIMYASPSTKEVLGYRLEELLGREGRTLIHPDDLGKILPVLLKLNHRQGASETVECRVRHKNGSYIWTEVTATNRLKNPLIRATIVNYRDISAKKEIEIVSAEAEAIIHSSDDAILTKTLEGIITSWNPAAERLFDYTAKEVIGKHISLIVPRDLLDQENEIMAKLRRGEKIDHFETLRINKQQVSLDVSLSISPLLNPDGVIIGASNITRDIREKKQQEQSKHFLATASEMLSSSIDYSTTLQNIASLIVPALADYTRIVILDDKRRIQEIAVNHSDKQMSPKVKELYNVYAHNSHTHGVDKIIDSGKPEYISNVWKGDSRLALESDPKLKKVVEELHLVSYIGVPIKTRKRIIGAIVFSSTSDNRQYTLADVELASELALRAGYAIENALLYKHAQRAISLRDEFLGVASHELKTPVTSLKAFGQVLQQRALKRGDIQSALLLKKMDQQINRLSHLITDLLDVTKIDSGKLQFHNEQFTFDELVDEVIKEVGRTTETHYFVRKGMAKKVIQGDRERIGQVVTNLLTNAIKYSPKNSSICIETRGNDGHITCCVKDAGIGIDAKRLPHIFKRFYRETDKLSHTFPGLGLGLYISSEIIRRQNGRIWVESVKGKGSTFCFYLPLNALESSQFNSGQTQQYAQKEKPTS